MFYEWHWYNLGYNKNGFGLPMLCLIIISHFFFHLINFMVSSSIVNNQIIDKKDRQNSEGRKTLYKNSIGIDESSIRGYIIKDYEL